MKEYKSIKYEGNIYRIYREKFKEKTTIMLKRNYKKLIGRNQKEHEKNV